MGSGGDLDPPRVQLHLEGGVITSSIRVLLTLFICLVVLCLGTSTASSAATPRYHMRTEPVIVDARDLSGMTQVRSPISRPAKVEASVLSPGTKVGTTFIEYQHNGSTGRQVDISGSTINVCWWKLSGTYTVNFNILSVAGSPTALTLNNGDTLSILPLSAPLTVNGLSLLGYEPALPNIRNTPSGKAVSVHRNRQDPALEERQFWWEARLQLFAGMDFFNSIAFHAPYPAGPEYPLWLYYPKQAISACGSDIIHHGIAHCRYGLPPGDIWYWRGVVHDSNSTMTWNSSTHPVLIDSGDTFMTAAVEAKGDMVYIALARNMNPTNADLVYYRSTDCGSSWEEMTNATGFTASDPEGLSYELDAVIDGAGDLHVIYSTFPSSGTAYPTSLYHWSSDTGPRLITSAGWINTCAEGTLRVGGFNNGAGINQLALADCSIAIKPAGVHGISEELIYAIWAQYGPTDNDCATVDALGTPGGPVNSEIYCSVSSNNGLSWDRPQNITGTVTPDCLPGDCMAEGWVTAAAIADSGVYISYVEDLFAGMYGRDSTDNPYSVLAMESRRPVPEPIIAVTPQSFIELNADPSGTPETVELNIISVGNSDLVYTVDVTADNAGQSHVSVNGSLTYSNVITPGGPPDVISVSYETLGLGDPEEVIWRLAITSNDPTSDPGQGGSPIDVSMQVFSASTWWTCQEDTLSTGLHRMQVSSCLEMGDNGAPGAGFMSMLNSESWLYSGSPVVTRVHETGDTVAYHNAYLNTSERVRTLNKSFRAQSDFNIVRDSLVTSGDSTYTVDVAFGAASSTDTTIGIDYEILFYKNPALTRGAAYKLSMQTLTGSTISGVHYGLVCDIDLPMAGINRGIASEALSYIGGMGGSDSSGIFVPTTDYMAFFYVPPTGPCAIGDAVAGQVIANPNYVYPEAQFNVDSLYALFNTFGAAGTWDSSIHIDTGQTSGDISLILVNGYSVDLQPGTPVEWSYGLAVSDISIEDLEQTISSLRVAANEACAITCLIEVAGDVDVSGSITSADIIALVNFVFKGSGPPRPCEANGDVNCSGSVTSADIIAEVNYVFKGGDPPCDICDWSPMSCS